MYSLADSGEISFDKTHTCTKEEQRSGSGIIKNMAYGAVLPEADLLGYSITDSDNTAFRMLLNTYGTDGVKKFISQAGGRTNNLGRLANANIDIMDTVFYAKLTYNYIEVIGANNEKLKKDLLASSTSYIRLNHPTASKYGFWDKAMHDMSIVYSNSPYILVIMSDKGVANDDDTPRQKDHDMFRTISEKVQELDGLLE